MQIERISSFSGDTQYNAYLIKGSMTALVDSAPNANADGFIERLEALTDISSIDYFIFTHTDRARAGAADVLTGLNPDARVVASIAGLRNIKEITNRPVNELAAKDGMEIDLGGITVRIMITPNINWPDTLMLYIKEEKALFSGMLFGGSEPERFYKEELALYSDFAKTAVERAQELDIDMIYPSVGEPKTGDIISAYSALVTKETKRDRKTAAIIYAGHETGYTYRMTVSVEAAMSECGYDVRCISCMDSIDLAVEEMNAADILCFASPTIHRNAVPEIMDVISRSDRVNKVRTPCMVTGSYGWGGEALGFMYGYLKMLKLRVFEKPFGVIMKPLEEQLCDLREYTRRFCAWAEEFYDNK